MRVVQFCDNLPLTRLGREELDQFIAEAAKWELAIEIVTRGLDCEDLRRHLTLAVELRSPFVRVITDRGDDRPAPHEAVSPLRAVLPEFIDRGVKIAIENHDRFSAATLARMVGELGEEHVGICRDTVNSLGCLEPPDVVVEKLAPLALNLHVKDFTVECVGHQMGFVVEGRPAGEGMLALPPILDALRTARRDVNAILELWTPPAASIGETIAREEAWAARSIAYLRNLVN